MKSKSITNEGYSFATTNYFLKLESLYCFFYF